MKTNLILIGMMGSGKTTIGKLCGRLLCLPFYDTDNLITQRQGMDIPRIFETRGEKYFRSVESEVIKSLRDKKNTIISTGGGAILSEENTAVLREVGYIIYLRATIDTLIKNLINSKNQRPLLKADDPKQRLEEILYSRREIYEKSCDHIIDTDNKTIDEICDLVIQCYQNRNNINT